MWCIYKCLSPWQQKRNSKSNTRFHGPRPLKIDKYPLFIAMIYSQWRNTPLWKEVLHCKTRFLIAFSYGFALSAHCSIIRKVLTMKSMFVNMVKHWFFLYLFCNFESWFPLYKPGFLESFWALTWPGSVCRSAALLWWLWWGFFFSCLWIAVPQALNYACLDKWSTSFSSAFLHNIWSHKTAL